MLKQVDAELRLGLGRVQLVRESWQQPIDIFGSSHQHRLELVLLPRLMNARGCFPDDWGPHRFEPMGPLFLLPAGHRVHAKSDCREQHSVVCIFDPASVTAWFDCDLNWTHRRLQGSLDIVSVSIRNLVFRIGEEIRSPGFARVAMVELLAAQAAIELSRHLMGIDTVAPPGGLAAWRLRLIDERLAETGAPPSLTELAALCNLSARHLTRAFRISRGMSIGSYMVDRCMKNAKRLLASGAQVKFVAFAMGFTAASNFATAFQRATGESPRQYRMRARGAGAPARLAH